MELKQRSSIFPEQMTMTSSSYSSRRRPMEEIAVALKRFGDDQSTLLDQFERLSFEVQLNRAILGRSLSEPATACSSRPHVPPDKDEVVVPSRKGRKNIGGFQKALKKLLKPILEFGRRKKKGPEPDEVAVDSKSITAPTTDLKRFPVYSKAFSRSLRV